MSRATLTAGPSFDEVLSSVAALVRSRDRNDLAEAIDSARLALAKPSCRVIVCGEFKVGKSRLVNALLNAHVCRADAEVATAEPVVVRFGPEFTSTPMEVDESGGRGVAVTLPRRLLADGVELVDTPGVGRGLSDAHTAATLRVLATTDALLFVSEAGKEFSAPELEFLVHAVELCPVVVCVLTKIDFHPEWRRILELDLGHLAHAGVAAPILPVSSALRQQALSARSAQLDEESGFPALIAMLREGILRRRRSRAIDAATRVAVSMLDETRSALVTEQLGLGAVDGGALIVKLRAAEQRADELRGGDASWQQTLVDRIEDLRSDIDADLSVRLLDVRKAATDRIGNGIPAKIWPDLEPWLYRRANEELLAHFVSLRTAAEALAADVLDRFGAEAEQIAIEVDLPEPQTGSASLSGLPKPRVSLVEAGIYAARGPGLSITLAHALAALVGLSTGLALPMTALLGAALGRKTWRSARSGQMQTARAEMLRAVYAYLDECNVSARKASRDALRAAERQLRDSLTTRAAQIHRTALVNLDTARTNVASDQERRETRGREVAAELAHVARLDLQIRAMEPIATSDTWPPR